VTRGVVAALMAACGVTVAAQQPPAPAPVFRTGVDIVVVEATVVDRDSRVVEGLTPADFEVEVSGKRREVASTELVRYANVSPDLRAVDPDISTNTAAVSGRTLLVIVDTVSLVTEARSVLETAKRWLDTLGPSDRVGLATLPLPGTSVEFTTNRAAVAAALDRIMLTGKVRPPFDNRNVSLWEGFRIYEGDTFVFNEVVTRECKGEPLCPQLIRQQAAALYHDSQAHVQPVLRHLGALFKGMGVIPGPKHVLLLSSGWAMSERNLASEMLTLAREATRADVTVHSFTTEQWSQTASRSRPSPKLHQDTAMLTNSVESVAGLTGGRSVRLAGTADTVFAALTAGLGGYYRLAVRAQPEDLDGRDHRITLKVRRDGARLNGYRRVLAAGANAPASVEPRAALRAALESPNVSTGLEIRATAYVMQGEDASKRSVRVVVTGDTGGTPGPATAVAALYTLDGRPVTAMENIVEVPNGGTGPLIVSLSVPPDAYLLKIAARDVDGRIGSVERQIDARWKKVGAFETTGLVLLRAGGASGTLRPLFGGLGAGERLLAQVPLAGGAAGQKPQVTFEVLGETGPAPVLRPTSGIGMTSGGTMVAEASVLASSLPPGRYTVRANVRGAAPLIRRFVVQP
jgi:VWFA-related protein